MAQLPKPTLKSYYETGDIPTESEFASLIDSLQATLVAGDNITLSSPDPLSGVVTISASTGDTYVLPTANSTTLGGVKPVDKTSGMTQDVGVDATGKLYTLAYSYTLPTASSNTLGGIYASELPSSDNSYECKIGTSSKLYASVPIASGDQLGVVKAGSGLNVSSTGTLTVLQANSSVLGGSFLYDQTGQNTNGSVTQKVITDLTNGLSSAVNHLGDGNSIRVLKDDSEQAVYLLFCTTQGDVTTINNIIASQGNGLIATQGLGAFTYTDNVSTIQSKLVEGIATGSAAEIKLNTSKAKFDNWSGVNLTRWAGTSTQYNSISSKDANTLYFATGSGVYIGSTKVADIGGGGSSYVLPPATTSVLGGVIVGSGLNVNTSGLLSVKAAAPGEAGIVKLYGVTGNNTDGTMTQSAITTALGNTKSETINQVQGLIDTSRYSSYSDWGSTPPSGNLIPLANLSDDGNTLITFLNYGTSITSYTLNAPATGKEGCQFTFVFNNNADLSMSSWSGWTLYKSSGFNSMPSDIGGAFLKVVSGVIIGGNKIIINSAFYSA